MKTSSKRATIAIVSALIIFTSASVASAAKDRKTYALPQAAVDDFVAAIRDYDLDALKKIFGEDSQRLFVSEDPVADKNMREEFLRLYDENHEIMPQG